MDVSLRPGAHLEERAARAENAAEISIARGQPPVAQMQQRRENVEQYRLVRARYRSAQEAQS
jgi:hypothetical protein